MNLRNIIEVILVSLIGLASLATALIILGAVLWAGWMLREAAF